MILKRSVDLLKIMFIKLVCQLTDFIVNVAVVLQNSILNRIKIERRFNVSFSFSVAYLSLLFFKHRILGRLGGGGGGGEIGIAKNMGFQLFTDLPL